MSTFPSVIYLYIYIYNSSIKFIRFCDCLLANFRFTTGKLILKFDAFVQSFDKYKICVVCVFTVFKRICTKLDT
jgi:hypothetical protein